MELVDRRTDGGWLGEQYGASQRRVCGLMGMAVSSYRYRSRRSDESLRERLVRLAREKPRYGYRRLQVLVEREGERVNHKRLWRVYREAGLCLKRKKRRYCVRVGSPRPALSGANQEWALDFAHDAIATDRKIRVLSVVDVYTRECLALEADTGFASRRVTRVLDEVIAVRGLPQAIRCDNGPELTSRHFLAWALEWKIELRHIQPGKPTQKAHVERASTAGCGKSACGSAGLTTCSTHAGRWLTGRRSTTNNGHTAASAIEPRPSLHAWP
jgi:putative transposase